jgi:hypothetical protein
LDFYGIDKNKYWKKERGIKWKLIKKVRK